MSPDLTFGPANTCRLLVVEDNAADSQLAVATLQGASHTTFDISTAETLTTALRALASETFDAILLDLDLPDSKGVDTVRRLRADNARVAVVVLSGAYSEELRGEVLREGAQDFIMKSEPAAQLLARCILYAVERLRAQEAHRQVRQLIDANPDAVLVVDQRGVVRYVNAAASHLFARTETELVGEWLGFSIGPDAATEIEIVGHQPPHTGEIRVAEIEWQGEPAVLASIRDVTENRRLADQLREAQKMEAVGILAGGIAHDFNNLLVVMMGNIEFLLDACDEDDPRREMAERIEYAAERARHLTGQLLVFSRRQPSRPVPLDPNQIVLRLYNMIRRSFPESIELVFVPNEEAWNIRVDPNEFDQLLMNLTLNARHAMPDGGRVQIDIANVRIDRKHDNLKVGEYVCFYVSDTGTGIKPEHQARVFEPFFTTKPVGSGSGLGLAICRSIAQNAGGDIWLESDQGRGSTFEVILPRCTEAAAPPEPTGHDEARPRGDERILVVEDDHAVATAITHALDLSGFEIMTATNGEQAKRLIEQTERQIDLVLSDVVMPRMSGHELDAWMRVARPRMKLLLMTGYTDNAEALAAETTETRGLLFKPFMPAQLLRTVRDLLDRRA